MTTATELSVCCLAVLRAGRCGHRVPTYERIMSDGNDAVIGGIMARETLDNGYRASEDRSSRGATGASDQKGSDKMEQIVMTARELMSLADELERRPDRAYFDALRMFLGSETRNVMVSAVWQVAPGSLVTLDAPHPKTQRELIELIDGRLERRFA